LKKLLLFGLILLSAAKATGESVRLQDHMRSMGRLLDEINARANEPINFSEAAAKSRELRRELVLSISIDPNKFLSMSEKEQRDARIEYHKLMARVIYLSATLEKTLEAEDDFGTQSGTRIEDVRNLLHEINVLVGKAHQKFR